MQLVKSGNDILEDLMCRGNVEWLVRRQKALLCRRNGELSAVIRKAATQAVTECRYQFSNELWNCPLDGGRDSSAVHDVPILKKIEKSGK